MFIVYHYNAVVAAVTTLAAAERIVNKYAGNIKIIFERV